MSCGPDEHYTVVEMIKWLAKMPPATKIAPNLVAPASHYAVLAFSVGEGVTTAGETMDKFLALIGTAVGEIKVTDYTTVSFKTEELQGDGQYATRYVHLNPTKFRAINEKIIVLRGGRVTVERRGHVLFTSDDQGTTEHTGCGALIAMFDEIYSRQSTR